jgi:hypothetical protein
VNIHRFPLQGEFIELNVLLKLLALAPSGGAAKAMIAEGAVVVDGDGRDPASGASYGRATRCAWRIKKSRYLRPTTST